ncbi:MAG TPA: hypothetical protein VHB27_18170 [Rhodopila sp.]|uniref:hypothetical protein n=1 Tax=Rhodopila sp. TaxID=2480087 RepID=UPI002C6359AD|nr:hypothetical protein [Rhodopila sp.]HVY17155.1 hypothetical protein [Rhodopila sp.]
MPARIVLVHDDSAFRAAAADALTRFTSDIRQYTDALDAMAALDEARKIELLITKIEFDRERSNGAALVQMARSRKRGVSAILIGHPKLHPLVQDLGRCLPAEVDIAQLVAISDEELQRAHGSEDAASSAA